MDSKVSSSTSPSQSDERKVAVDIMNNDDDDVLVTATQIDDKMMDEAKDDHQADIGTTADVETKNPETLANNLEALNLNSSPTLSSSSSSHNITSTISETNANSGNAENTDSANNTTVPAEEPPSSTKATYSGSNVLKYGTKIPNRVFVGGIPDEASDNDVRQLFAQYGNIQSVKIITDRAGISKGYGFVTFERDDDAQKVIKEADNLIIKNRKLNVSTAVMKHHNNFDQKMLNNSFMYSNLMFPNANYSQFYENLQGYSTAEGLPLYQIGLNGHFVSNCPPLLASSATTATGSSYVGQTYSASYQNPANYLYPGVSAGNTTMPMTLQQALYQQPSVASQPLLSGNGANAGGTIAAASHAFQYPTAAIGNPSSSVSSGYRYPLGSAAQSTQQQQQQHQYNPYQGSVNPTGVNNASMNLLSMMSQSTVPDGSNATSPPQKMSANGGNGGGGAGQAAAQMMPHVPNPSNYSPYPSNMAPNHSMNSNTNAIQNVHLKTDASNMEMMDGGGLISTPTATSYFMVNNDLMWSSHVPPNAAYGGPPAIPTHSLNNMANNNGKPHHQMISNSSNNRATNHMNHGSKSSTSNATTSSTSQSLHQANMNSNGTGGASLKATASIYSSNSNQYSSSSNRDKMSNARHNPSSYTSSHKKMYNGNNGNNYYNSHHVSNQAKSRVMNGGSALNNGRHGLAPPPTIDLNERSNHYHHHQSNMAMSSSHHHQQHGQQQQPQHHLRHPPPPMVAAYSNSRLSQHNNVSYITKTINGVQIYALADNNNGGAIAAGAMNGSETGNRHHAINNTPPQSPNASPLFGTNLILYKT